jgi:aryl-alcohol dehydrogenase-like predicted oxidoreductase
VAPAAIPDDAAGSATLSREHLSENLAAAEIELTDDEFEALR